MKKLIAFECARKNPATMVLLLYSVVITSVWFSAQSEVSRQTRVSTGIPHTHPAPWNRTHESNQAPRTTPAHESAAPAARMDWSTLESDDFATYVANLRASGCPEETVRRIVTAEVRETFDRERVNQLDVETIPFWDVGYNANEAASPEFEKLAADEMALLASRIHEAALSGADCSGAWTHYQSEVGKILQALPGQES